MISELHAHSTASDGTLSPSALVRRASNLGVEVLSITDHDSVEGLREAQDAADDAGITFVNGVELSAVHEGRDVHILGYFVDERDADLLAHLADLRAARHRRAETIVSALQEAGYPVTIEQVLAFSDGGAVGRSHVARALVAGGHAESISDAFRRLLGRGRPFYVPKDVRSPSDAVQVVLDARGIPVLAHPGITGVDAIIEPLVQSGLRGIEAFHAEHTTEQRLRYARLAGQLGLMVTGGTDYHGPEAPNPELGSVELPEGAVERLLESGMRRR
jgi:predicted metal-dependent phosphoesterase TrpH